jgi:hypothetical protein
MSRTSGRGSSLLKQNVLLGFYCAAAIDKLTVQSDGKSSLKYTKKYQYGSV